MFTLSQLLEKQREYSLPIFVAFIDFNKAFDRVEQIISYDVQITSSKDNTQFIRKYLHKNQRRDESNKNRSKHQTTLPTVIYTF